MQVNVIGATGGAGRAIAEALVEADLDVVGVDRSGSSPVGRAIGADITTDDGARAAVVGADTVVMAAQPPYHRWPEDFPPMLERVMGAAADVSAKLVMVDNLYAYGPAEMPISETTPHRATDPKGRVRSEMLHALLAAHEVGRLRVAVGQASDYVGPHAPRSTITALTVDPVAGGGDAARWVGSLDVPHAVAFLPDVARAYVSLVTDDRADGQAWVLPHVGAPTGREFIAALAAAAGRPIEAKRLPIWMLRVAAPFHRDSRELLGIAHQWTEPWTVDSSAFESTFGKVERTLLDDAVAATLHGPGVAR
ncbi:MAG: NAD-dependent epimerase/dehydratase family protein [Acidimicrobiia bacterium]